MFQLKDKVKGFVDKHKKKLIDTLRKEIKKFGKKIKIAL
jgi:hypothetical protein